MDNAFCEAHRADLVTDPAISIVITSYNYARYVGAAVESALAQTRPCEVVVVDDGSTDDSLEVLARFGDRITLITKPNGGEASAMYAGLLRASGNLIIFLDSDDLLYPHCAETVARHVAQGVNKIQWRLDLIGAAGENRNNPFPVYPPDLSSDAVMRMALSAGAYPSPPNSGIAYTRTFLQRVLPLDDERLRHNADTYLTRLAPLYGKVVTVPDIMGAYRIHSANFWEADNRAERYSMYVAHDLATREAFRAHAARMAIALPPAWEQGNLYNIECRILSQRLTPDRHPVPQDRRWPLLRTALAAALRSQEHSMPGRLVWAGYFTALGFAPVYVLRHHLPKLRQAGKRNRFINALAELSRLRLSDLAGRFGTRHHTADSA